MLPLMPVAAGRTCHLFIPTLAHEHTLLPDAPTTSPQAVASQAARTAGQLQVAQETVGALAAQIARLEAQAAQQSLELKAQAQELRQAKEQVGGGGWGRVCGWCGAGVGKLPDSRFWCCDMPALP